eukprot:scaffold46_cov19-Tisochrysis_lutea.AAC.1
MWRQRLQPQQPPHLQRPAQGAPQETAAPPAKPGTAAAAPAAAPAAAAPAAAPAAAAPAAAPAGPPIPPNDTNSTHTLERCAFPPLLSQAAADGLLEMLWSNMDEPLAQTLRQ